MLPYFNAFRARISDMFHAVFRKHSLLFVAVFFCGMAADSSPAQTQSLFGDRGPASQIGTNLTGSRVGGSSTFGTSSAGGLIGQPLTGSQNGLSASSSLTTTNAAAGATGTQAGFIGRRDNAGRFVGNSLVDGAIPETQSLDIRGSGRGRGGSDRRNIQRGARPSTPSTSGSRPAIRSQQRIGFNYTRPDSPTIQSSLTTQLERVASHRTELRAVSLVVTGQGHVTLRGTVDSEQTKRLAALLVRLEPGVRDLHNELAVQTRSEQREVSE